MEAETSVRCSSRSQRYLRHEKDVVQRCCEPRNAGSPLEAEQNPCTTTSTESGTPIPQPHGNEFRPTTQGSLEADFSSELLERNAALLTS